MAVALVAGAATMTGCDDDFDRPPVIVPEATIEANTTIFELKEKYWQGTTSDFMTTIGTTDSGEHVIIGGRVVSSDEEGNVYQRIVLEDETSSIFVRIYSTKLFESYQYGQEVRIDVTGLLIGTYRGLMMIGVDYNGSVGGMDLDVFKQRAQVNGLPDKAAIPQYVTTISDIKSYLTDQTQLMTWQSRLITLENVQFVGGGSEMFGTPGAANYTTRQLKDAEGNTLDISTSNRCEFVNLLMPAGTGTVNAILSYYGSNWQLVFSDPETDCTGFTWVDTPTTPEVPADGGDGSAETPFTVQAVQAGAAGTGKWVTGYIVGFIPDKYYDQAVFGTEGAINTNILLAPAADVTDVAACIPVALVGDLRTAVGLGGHPENLGKQVTIYGDLEKYFGQPGLKNTSLYAWGDKGGETPEVPDTPTGNVLYSALLSTDTEISTGWAFENANLPAALTYIWSWKSIGSTYYLNASAFYNSAALESTGYAFSPVIDLSGTTTAKMTFDHAAKFQTTLRSLCSAVVREEGATEWTELAIPTWPEAGSWSFVNAGEIDLAAYAGKKIQVGFKYGSSTAGADTWEIKNLKITE